MTASYRKTKTGQWVVFGPASIVRTGRVNVTKRDGTTRTETVESVGKTFTCDGLACCYGYIAEHASHRRSVPVYERCIQCGGHGNVEQELEVCGVCGTDFDWA